MGKISGGRVAYRRTIQPAPYESKTAECELSFSTEEDDGVEVEDTAANVLDMCKVIVQEALFQKKRRD